jgi:CheY-like chemotaxis protein
MTNKPKILVVEDEIENQKYLQLVLRKKFNIDFCDTKNSMFDLLTENEYKTIIMDISLKNGYTGVDLIKELKRKSDYKNIPIVCLSAHAYGENKRKAEELGANFYLTKPVTNKVLLSTLDKLINLDTGEETEA